MRKNFNAGQEVDGLIRWIREYFTQNGPGANAVIGISGGKDSTVAAMLCVAALGPERVIGVMMPNGEQADIKDAQDICNRLRIRQLTVNIGSAVKALYESIDASNFIVKGGLFTPCNEYAPIYTNTPPRIRMTTLYNIAAASHGRVVRTCNLDENYIGWFTKYGDGAGDFSPLLNLSSNEVVEIGKVMSEYFDIPLKYITKTPDDGMCGVSDEDKFGFSYQELEDYRKNESVRAEAMEKIYQMHRNSEHKRDTVPYYVRL